jgi:hypothetical protein
MTPLTEYILRHLFARTALLLLIAVGNPGRVVKALCYKPKGHGFEAWRSE